MIVLCVLLYIIPVAIVLYGGYKDMYKGETVEHYLNRCDLDTIFWVLTFFPIFNWFMAAFIMIDIVSKTIWNKIKHWKK